MIRHTPFKPLLLPALIAGVFSASYSFNVSADIYSDGYNAGYGAGQSSCPPPTTTIVEREVIKNVEVCSNPLPCTPVACTPVACTPTTNTVTNTVESCSGTAYTNAFNDGKNSVAACTDGQTTSCLLTSSQKAVSNSLSTYDTNSHALISVAENNKITDNTYCNSAREGAAAKLSKDLFLTLPNLDASALDKDLKTSSANLKYQAEGFVIDNKGAHAFTVESFINTPLPNPSAKVKLRLLAVGGVLTINPDTIKFDSELDKASNTDTTKLVSYNNSSGLTDTATAQCTSDFSSCNVSFKFGNGKEKITLPKVDGANWKGDCNPPTTDTSGSCTVDLNKPYQTVVLAFDKVQSSVPLKVEGTTTLNKTDTAITATTTLSANANGGCSLDPASSVSPLTYTLFNSGSECTLTASDSAKTSLKVAAPATLPTFSAAKSNLSVNPATATTGSTVTVSATLLDSSGNAFTDAAKLPSKVVFIYTQVDSTGNKLADNKTITPAPTCAQNTCTATLPSISTASTVMVSGTLDGSPFGTPQIISIK